MHPAGSGTRKKDDPNWVVLVPVTGVEPVRFFGARDFKSLVSAYSTTPAGSKDILSRIEPAVKSEAFSFLRAGSFCCLPMWV